MTQLVFIDNGKPVTDSLTVAETFSKDHKHVTRDIRELECSEEFHRSNFGLVDYIDAGGRTYQKYLITQDGFSFLVMGFTGKEAARFKEMYIGEFNRMRDQLQRGPQTQLEVLQVSIQQLIDQERRLAAVETRLDVTEKRQEDIKEVLSLNPIDGRKKVTALLNRIAQTLGGGSSYQDVRSDSYQRLESRGECNLAIRQTNKRKKMALEGVAKSKIDKVSKLDVIFDDARLTEIYFAVVKEMAIQNRIDPEGIAS